MKDKDMFYSALEYKVLLILEYVDGVKPSIQTMELQWFSICPTGEVCVIPVTMHCVITMQHRPKRHKTKKDIDYTVIIIIPN